MEPIKEYSINMKPRQSKPRIHSAAMPKKGIVWNKCCPVGGILPKESVLQISCLTCFAIQANTITDPWCIDFQSPLDKFFITLQPNHDSTVRPADPSNHPTIIGFTPWIDTEKSSLLAFSQGMYYPGINGIISFRNCPAVVKGTQKQFGIPWIPRVA